MPCIPRRPRYNLQVVRDLHCGGGISTNFCGTVTGIATWYEESGGPRSPRRRAGQPPPRRARARGGGRRMDNAVHAPLRADYLKIRTCKPFGAGATRARAAGPGGGAHTFFGYHCRAGSTAGAPGYTEEPRCTQMPQMLALQHNTPASRPPCTTPRTTPCCTNPLARAHSPRS